MKNARAKRLFLLIKPIVLWRSRFLNSLILDELTVNEQRLSNSLIIHREKAKEITTVKEVWKCGIVVKFGLRSYSVYQTLKRVFHQISKHLEVG